ncbi:hypothetical protein [Ruegeria arenilitoris]|uniref:hypothetical protein n=2 Tax=Ruegeria arenilitoris TaxID=1173585 RepID=UPI00147ED6BC|nr:hypothetical protein [Ruegeria arenilitoris]
MRFHKCLLDDQIFRRNAEFMGVLKTLIASSVFLCVSAANLYADDELVKSFASCAGRYSAEIEHAWLLDDPNAKQYEMKRKGFVSLLNATIESDNAQHVLSHRVNAKHAHSALLQTGTFGSDAATSTAARRTAARLLYQCNLLLLGGT